MLPIRNRKWKNLIILFTSFTILIILFEIIPRALTLSGSLIEWYDQKTTLNSAEESELELKSVQSENLEIKNEISTIVSDYEDNRNISSVINVLNSAAGKAGIKITTIRPAQIKKEDNLWLQDIKLEITGNYEQIFNFIRFIENSTKVILINNMTVNPEKVLDDKLNSIINLSVYLNL